MAAEKTARSGKIARLSGAAPGAASQLQVAGAAPGAAWQVPAVPGHSWLWQVTLRVAWLLFVLPGRVCRVVRPLEKNSLRFHELVWLV